MNNLSEQQIDQLLQALIPIIVTVLLISLVEIILNYLFYKKMNYRHAWFAIFPIVSSYISIKLIYDAWHMDKKLTIRDLSDFLKYDNERRSKSISIFIIVTILSMILGVISAIIESAMMTNTKTELTIGYNADTLLSIIDPLSILIGLIFLSIINYSIFKLTQKNNQPFNKQKAIILAIIIAILNIFTLGLAYVIFIGLRLNSDFIAKDQYSSKVE